MNLESALKILLLCTHALLTAAYVVGWCQGPLAPLLGLPSPFRLHLASAGLAAMLSVFSNLFVIFYFIGTGMWIKDQAYAHLASDKAKAERIWHFFERANALKGKAFPFASMVLLLAVFTAILGGARQIGAVPAWLHPGLATLMVLIAWAGLRLTWDAIDANVQFLDLVSQELEV